MLSRWYACRGTQVVGADGTVLDVVEVDVGDPEYTYLVQPADVPWQSYDHLMWVPVWWVDHSVLLSAHVID